MQPRNIEVFDGLRVTTEHIDHLQGAIHSAIADVRELLGLGRVHRGFEITQVDDHTIQIDPGFAFDNQRRRIVSDEPVLLEVPALEPGTERYAYAAYGEVADGESEGRPTRVWDSASVTVREARAEPDDAAILLARLVGQEGGGFAIEPPDLPVSGAAEPAEAEAAAPEAAPEPPPAAPPKSATVELAEREVVIGTGNGFTAFLREQLVATTPPPPFRQLVSAEPIALDGTEWSVTAHTAISVALAVPPLPAEPGAPPTEAPPAGRAAGSFQGTALIDGSDITQAGTGMIMRQAQGTVGLPEASASTARIGTMRLGAASFTPGDLAADLARGLRAEVALRRAESGVIEAGLWLAWDGTSSEPLAAWLDTTPARALASATVALIATPPA